MNPNDANLLNSFFTGLKDKPIAIPKQKGVGGANFFNQVFLEQWKNKVRQEAMRVKEYYLTNEAQLHYILHQDPELANAVASGDDDKLIEIIGKRLKD